MQPEASDAQRLTASPAGAGRRESMGVAAYHHAMPMRYHGAEVKSSMRCGVSMPLMARYAAWYARPSTRKEIMRFTLRCPSR